LDEKGEKGQPSLGNHRMERQGNMDEQAGGERAEIKKILSKERLLSRQEKEKGSGERWGDTIELAKPQLP